MRCTTISDKKLNLYALLHLKVINISIIPSQFLLHPINSCCTSRLAKDIPHNEMESDNGPSESGTPSIRRKYLSKHILYLSTVRCAHFPNNSKIFHCYKKILPLNFFRTMVCMCNTQLHPATDQCPK